MNGEEQNLKEQDSEVKNFKLQIMNFWENYKANWVWVNIGALSTSTFFLWLLFLLDILSLVKTIFYTMLFPSLLIMRYYIMKSTRKDLITKIVFVGCGGYTITVVIWLFAGSILIVGSNPLLHGLWPQELDWVFLLILMGLIYGIVAYLMYRYGEKKEWGFTPKY